MLDLAKLAEEFSVKAHPSCDNTSDLNAIRAINNPSMDEFVRQKVIADWIVEYKAHRIRGASAKHIADVVITFADSERSLQSPLTRSQILSAFAALETKISEYLMALEHKPKHRSIDSLTSKALWLCYPHDIPILDRFAENALRVLTRLQGCPTLKKKPRYEVYIDAWFALYEEVKNVISPHIADTYPYNVRVFDRLLLWLGEDRFPKPSDLSWLKPNE